MKANFRYYEDGNEKDYLLDLEAETDEEINFLKWVKKVGVMPVQLQRKDAETLVLPVRDFKIQFNFSEGTIKELQKLLGAKTQ